MCSHLFMTSCFTVFLLRGKGFIMGKGCEVVCVNVIRCEVLCKVWSTAEEWEEKQEKCNGPE